MRMYLSARLPVTLLPFISSWKNLFSATKYCEGAFAISLSVMVFPCLFQLNEPLSSAADASFFPRYLVVRL